MKRLALALCALLAAALLGQPAIADPVFPDRGRAAVVDAAGVIPQAEEDQLNTRIVGWVQKTGHQLAVVTVPSLEGYDIKDYGYQLGRAWALGDKGKNDGVILLLAPKERKVRIEVGYGLEPVLTDGLTSQIIRDRIVPQLKAGETAMALSDGADAIMEAATMPVPATAPVTVEHDGSRFWAWLVTAVALSLIGWTFLWLRKVNSERRRAIQRLEERRIEKRSEIMSRADAAPARPYTYGQAPRARVNPGSPPNQGSGGSRPSPRPTAALPAARREPDRRSTDESYGSSATSFAAGYGLGSSSSSSSSDSGSSWGGSDSSSSSGYDSGGGSFGGGGSDSSY